MIQYVEFLIHFLILNTNGFYQLCGQALTGGCFNAFFVSFLKLSAISTNVLLLFIILLQTDMLCYSMDFLS